MICAIAMYIIKSQKDQRTMSWYKAKLYSLQCERYLNLEMFLKVCILSNIIFVDDIFRLFYHGTLRIVAFSIYAKSYIMAVGYFRILQLFHIYFGTVYCNIR